MVVCAVEWVVDLTEVVLVVVTVLVVECCDSFFLGCLFMGLELCIVWFRDLESLANIVCFITAPFDVRILSCMQARFFSHLVNGRDLQRNGLQPRTQSRAQLSSRVGATPTELSVKNGCTQGMDMDGGAEDQQGSSSVFCTRGKPLLQWVGKSLL